MNERPDQPDEGRLIGLAQKRSTLSARKAAAAAGLSEGRWRQIVSGYQTVSAGVYAPVRAPAETLARMAKVVGVTPEQLEQAGRPDAADELRAISPVARSGQGVDSKAEWDEIARLIAEYRRLVAEIIDRVPDRNRASVGAAADLTVSLMEESTSADRSK